jgi:hypothetical protein
LRRGKEEDLFSVLKPTDPVAACVLLPVTQAAIL